MRALPLMLIGLAAGCGHEQAWTPSAPTLPGPRQGPLPLQLTFNAGDDRAPTLGAAGQMLAFRRYDPVESSATCIAYLPVAGGTLRAMLCPPAPSPADTFVSTWSSPALSPDGQRVAFLWERSSSTSALGSWTSELAVGPADNPRAATVRVAIQESLTQAYVNTLAKPAWTSAGHVRFLASLDSIFKVKGGGAERFTDSIMVSRFVAELDVGAGTLAAVPGGDSAIAWAPGAGDEFWTVRAPARVFHVTGGVAIERETFSQPVADLALVNGVLVAALRDTAAVEWLDPATGARGLLGTSGPVRRLSPAGGRRFVAEVERGVVLFGSPANLWLYELP